jgi:hypothetical protein
MPNHFTRQKPEISAEEAERFAADARPAVPGQCLSLQAATSGQAKD